MHLKNFLSNPFNENNFIEFISQQFYGFAKNLKQSQYLGKVKLDDKSKIGFFIFKVDENKDIENTRVGFHHELKQYADKYILDGAIGAFYHPNQRAWRLSFIEFSYDDTHKQQVSSSKRFTFLLGNEKIRTALEQLKTTKYQNINQLKESFSVERVTKEFFEAYKNLFETLNQDLLPQLSLFDDENHLHAYSKKLLGRIVFIYFLQKKGWVGVPENGNWGEGDKNFLSNLYKQQPLNYYDDTLQNIFYKALNKKRENDLFTLGDCIYKMPFLNGGLFDKFNDDDRVILSDELFGNIFEMLDGYHFTIAEDTPHEMEVAIDPEMLGQVFENLLEENYRKGKGAFYTPREIVGYMCKNSIDEYLKDKEDKLQALKTIKVLDPAIGSGAFPMGMLHEIVQRRVDLEDKTESARLKREIIENSIYGVDIDGDAVEIAKLRFWLSLTVDETTPSPLPNLDFKIMQGNSLLETINGFEIIPTDIYEKVDRKQTDLFGGFEEQTLLTRTIYEELSEKIHKFYNDTNPNEKIRDKQEIKELVQKLIISHIDGQNEEFVGQINEANRLMAGTSAKAKATAIQESKKALDNSALAKKIIDDMLANNFQTKELFLYELFFAEVLKNGGFDVIIGNPPYIRQEKIKDLKPKLQIEGYNSFNGTADIYVYFFEQGHKLLKEGGILSFITSNKYTRAKYGKEFRDFVLKNTDILEYIDFNGVKVFESATVDTSILSFRKSALIISATKKMAEPVEATVISTSSMTTTSTSSMTTTSTSSMTTTSSVTFLYCDVKSDYKGENLEEYCQKNGFEYAQNDLSIDSFSFADSKELEIKKKIEAIGTPLKEWDIKIYRGILTGFNEAFIISQEKRDELITKDAKSAKIIKPILRGRDIKRYGYEFANLYLINTFNGDFVSKDLPRENQVDMDDYPAIKEHLDTYLPQLEKRADKGDSPYHLRNCAYDDEFQKEKIVYPCIMTQGSNFAFDDIKSYPPAPANIITGKNIKYVMACLNSKLVYYSMRKFYMGGGIEGELKTNNLLNVPIPKISQEEQQPFIDLVDKIMELKAQNKNTSKLENQIDEMVYKLYGLSDDEIGVVEGRE